jgi:asparagine synthetase B (glutamine-hydrolysing)
MIRIPAHRGPGGTGFHAKNGVGLAHARHSIIDLVRGQQPAGNEDYTQENKAFLFGSEIKAIFARPGVTERNLVSVHASA